MGEARRSAPRDTATFTAYYWEAYNEIVRPDRYDWYLITRWLKDLGPDGFTLLKVLRNLCYFNPREGTLRDTCQITVDELAEIAGMTRSTTYRLLETNEALRQFVQKDTEAIHIEGRTRRLPPRWRVCMDTPIHPDDMEEYDRLRGEREVGRSENIEEKRKSQIEIYEKRKSHFGISGGRKSQNEERKSQNPGRKSHFGILNKEVSLPSVYIPSDSLPAAPEKFDPPINPPEGEGERNRVPGDRVSAGEESLFRSLEQEGESNNRAPRDNPGLMEPDSPTGIWAAVLEVLAEQVQTGAIALPTWHGHLTRLRLSALTESEDHIYAVIIAPSAFTRDWVEKRHGERLRDAFATVLERESAAVTLEFRAEGK